MRALIRFYTSWILPKQTIDYGKTVIDGRLRYASPSAIERADASSNRGGGCLRSWFYRAVMGWKNLRPKGKGAETGDRCHDQIDTYLTTGQNVLDRISSAAKRYMPEPNSVGVHVELPLGGIKTDLSEAQLTIEGIPIVMYLDLVDRRGCYLDDDGSWIKDPLNTVEYLDWKFGSAKIDGKKSYAKRACDLPSDTQMVLGGLAIVNRFGAKHVRLSHVYTSTEGTPQASKATIIVDPEDLERRTEYLAGVVRILKDTAKERDPERVPGNQYACESFNGCPWMDSCSVWKQSGGLESYYGTSELERLTGAGVNMGILDGVSLPGMQLPPAAGHDVMAQLAQASAPQWSPAQPNPEFIHAVGVINSKGYGFVKLAGVAAQMFGVLNQYPGITPVYEVPGFGTLGATGKVIDDPNMIIGMARELSAVPQNPKGIEQRPATPAPAQLGILSPSAPQSDPRLAADPVPGFVHPGQVNALTPSVQVAGLIASVPPATAAAVLAQNSPVAQSTDAIPAERPKRKYTRRTKPDGTPSDVKCAHTAADDVLYSPGDDTGGGLWLFVNTRPNINTIDLAPWLQKLCDDIVREHRLVVPDVRTATGDHALSFGRWKGHITAYVRASAEKLEPGAYYLRTIGNEIAECALDGLRAARKGDDSVFELIVIGE